MAACRAPAAPASTTPLTLVSTPVATAVPVLSDAAPREEKAEKEPQQQATREGPSAGLHLHGRDFGVVRPDDAMVMGSGSSARVPGPTVEVGAVRGVRDVDGAARVIAAVSAGFRLCYLRALSADPTMAGVVALEAKIGPGGEVMSVVAKGARAELAACLAAVLRRAQFAPPEGGAATLTVPLTVTRQ